MRAEVVNPSCNWLCTGNEVFPAMLAAIDAAQESVCLETYTYSADELGQRFRSALIRARQRGVAVRVLIDALGSFGLSQTFWEPLRNVGGEARLFNPLRLNRMGIRSQRKLLVCDERVAFVGGFNISHEYDGDGVSCGWCDVGLKIEGPLAGGLTVSVNDMFARADFRHKPFMRLRRYSAKASVSLPTEQILFSGPGRGRSPLKSA